MSAAHECQRCSSDEWTWCDYRGCSSCYEPEPGRDELIRLRQLERRVRAIVGYYQPEDLAAHVAAAHDGGPTYHPDGVVRSVWVNHKLVDTIRTLYRELWPDEPAPPNR